MAQAFVMYLHSSTTAFQSQCLDFCKSPRWYEKVDVLPVRMASWKSDICTLTECRLQICYSQEAFCNVFCCREEYFFTLFYSNLMRCKNLCLLPRDEGGLYNSLNYRRLRSFLLGQRTDTGDRVQMAITVCRDTTPFTFPFSHFRLSYPHPLSSPKLGRMKPLEKWLNVILCLMRVSLPSLTSGLGEGSRRAEGPVERQRCKASDETYPLRSFAPRLPYLWGTK